MTRAYVASDTPRATAFGRNAMTHCSNGVRALCARTVPVASAAIALAPASSNRLRVGQAGDVEPFVATGQVLADSATRAPFPKFASPCSTLSANFGNQRALASL